MSIEVHQLKFHYQQNAFDLQLAQLDLSAGMTAVVGQNGAGKSTLFKLLMGLLPLQQGDITINGTTMNQLKGVNRLHEMGMLFQNPDDQLFNATVEWEVAWSVRQITQSHDEIKRVVTATLAQVGLMDKATENPFDLSLSDRKLLTFATLLAVNPRVYLLDEPMIALDWHSQTVVIQILRKLAQQGHQIIVSTHDMDLVATHFKRVVVFDQGKLAFDGSPRELFAQAGLLARIGLLPPRIMQICQQLGESQVYLNVADYVTQHRH